MIRYNGLFLLGILRVGALDGGIVWVVFVGDSSLDLSLIGEREVVKPTSQFMAGVYLVVKWCFALLGPGP